MQLYPSIALKEWSMHDKITGATNQLSQCNIMTNVITVYHAKILDLYQLESRD